MAIPNGGLINETNQQYYAGSQRFQFDGSPLVATFDTQLVLGSWDPSNIQYQLNNFKLYTSENGLPETYNEYQGVYSVVDNAIVFDDPSPMPNGWYVVIQLKTLTGGNYGNNDAYGDTVEKNLGEYQYTSLNDVIDAFMAIYVGEHKLIPDVKRTDVIFHAK